MRRFQNGVWPTMLTLYTEDYEVDENALSALIDWYVKEGVSGLFAVCQSSEIFYLTLAERLRLASLSVRKAAGRVPVIASGHVAYALSQQIDELKALADSGVDALILIANRLADPAEDDRVLLRRLERILSALPDKLPLGIYECPYPYKRLISPDVFRYLISSKRFYFLKDTCCDGERIEERLRLTRGTCLKIFNANTATLLDSLRAGGAGYSGVMANFHPKLYAWLCQNPTHARAESVRDFLSMAALIELRHYPANAKLALQRMGLPVRLLTRSYAHLELGKAEQKEVDQLLELSKKTEKELGL